MVVNYCFGATIADFDTVSVKYLVEAVIFVNLCGYISTEMGIKPYYTSFMVTLL